MDSETIYQPSPHVDPSPPTTPASFTPKRPPQLLYILGGVAVILFSIALAISFFGKGKITKPSSTGSSSTTASDTTSNWPKYTNIPFFYEIAIPPNIRVASDTTTVCRVIALVIIPRITETSCGVLLALVPPAHLSPQGIAGPNLLPP